MPDAVKVNFGCGQYPLQGWINVDFWPPAKADVRHDMNVFPYPFEDNSIDEILASHVLEHTLDPFAVMREFHRILKPGGRLLLRVPHFSRGFTHPDHRRGFDVTLPFYFDPKVPSAYSGAELHCEQTRLRWFAQPQLKRDVMGSGIYWVGVILGWWFDFWAKLSVFAASRIWCFWVGGFEEIEFVFHKPVTVG